MTYLLSQNKLVALPNSDSRSCLLCFPLLSSPLSESKTVQPNQANHQQQSPQVIVLSGPFNRFLRIQDGVHHLADLGFLVPVPINNEDQSQSQDQGPNQEGQEQDQAHVVEILNENQERQENVYNNQASRQSSIAVILISALVVFALIVSGVFLGSYLTL